MIPRLPAQPAFQVVEFFRSVQILSLTIILSPSVSAARASRCPIALGGPSVESLAGLPLRHALITTPGWHAHEPGKMEIQI